MLHIVKTTNLIIKRTPLLCGLLFAAVLALLPASAGAQCTNWDASGKWDIVQRGQRYSNELELQQEGRVLTGTARYSYVTSDSHPLGVLTVGGDPVSVDGTVDGTIDGDRFNIQIFWSNDSTGVYNGKVLPSGRLDGEGYEKSSPNIRVLWHSQGVLKCSPAGPKKPFKITSSITPPRPPPIKSSGKARPSEPPAPKLEPPFITASQVIRLLPSVPASVYLTWDGGPDHPNAEVWVSVNNQPEIPASALHGPVLKQPKIAGIELKLQGGVYKYVLKDAGKTLSTVVVVVP